MKAAWLDDYRRESFIDYHNGAVASDLMKDFDPVAYVDMIERAGANRHTCFIKCHHGFAYYPTEIGQPHPHLRGDYFGGIAAECHRRGIPVIAYYNTTRDGVAFDENPDWRQTKRDGTFSTHRHIKHVCVNSPYTTERMWPMIDEAIDRYPFIRGFFFDGTCFMPGTCFCEYCRRAMAAAGVNADNDAAASAFHVRSLREFIDATTARIAARVPDPAVYYNSPDFVGKADAQDGQIQLIIESLPSAWGYERTPFYGRYYRGRGKHVCAQTGRFHKAWADFGGLKSEVSLRYDAAIALALGASFAIGDQGRPDGRLEPAVFDASAPAFAHFAAREAWTKGAVSVPDVALMARRQPDSRTAKVGDDNNYGLHNILAQGHVQHDVIDPLDDLAPYAAVVCEDVPADEALAARLRDYVAGGGRLLVLGGTVFQGAGRATIESVLGAACAGLSPYTENYFRTPDGPLGEGLPRMDWITYGAAIHLRPATAEAAVELVYPWTEAKAFRTTSHLYAHSGRLAPFPAVTINRFGQGMAATVAAPLGALYQEHGYPPLRILALNVLRALIPPAERRLEVAAPLSVEAILTRQPAERRLVLHLIQFHQNRQTGKITVIEEIPPAFDVTARLRLAADPRRVTLAPEGRELPWRRDGGHLVIALDRFDLHAMIVIEE